MQGKKTVLPSLKILRFYHEEYFYPRTAKVMADLVLLAPNLEELYIKRYRNYPLFVTVERTLIFNVMKACSQTLKKLVADMLHPYIISGFSEIDFPNLKELRVFNSSQR